MMESLIMKYQERLGDPHLMKGIPPNLKSIDLMLRLAIGKTDDIKVARASHYIIKSMEAGERFCRVCGKDLSVVCGRVNDYLVLRHPLCKAPICFECSKNRPDAFYKAFKAGVEKYLGNKGGGE